MIFESGRHIRISFDIRIWSTYSNLVGIFESDRHIRIWPTYSNSHEIFESCSTFESQDFIFEYLIAHDLQTNIRIY